MAERVCWLWLACVHAVGGTWSTRLPVALAAVAVSCQPNCPGRADAGEAVVCSPKASWAAPWPLGAAAAAAEAGACRTPALLSGGVGT